MNSLIKPKNTLLFLSLSLLGVWVLGFIYIYITHPPYWSLMDDSTNLGYIQHIHQTHQSYWDFFKEYNYRDRFIWGMFRPIYPAFVLIFYGIFFNHPGLGYFFNFIFVLITFGIWALTFEKIKYPNQWPKKTGGILFLAMTLIFTPHYNLIFFASLQEKLMLFGLGFFTLLLANFSKQKISNGAFLILSFMSLLFAVYSKATTVFYAVPTIFWLFSISLSKNKKAIFIALFYTVIFISLGLYFSSIRGAYSADYNTSNLPQKLLNMGFRFQAIFSFGIFAILLHLFWLKPENSTIWRRLLNHPEIYFWPIGLISYGLIMLPWKGGIHYYLMAPTGVFIIGTMLNLLSGISVKLGNKTTLLFIVILFLFSLPAAIRLSAWASQHHHTISVVDFLNSQQNFENDIVAMPEPCYEAKGALTFYSERNSSIKVAIGDIFPATSPGQRKILVSDYYCPKRNMNNFENDVLLFSAGPWKVYEDIAEEP